MPTTDSPSCKRGLVEIRSSALKRSMSTPRMIRFGLSPSRDPVRYMSRGNLPRRGTRDQPYAARNLVDRTAFGHYVPMTRSVWTTFVSLGRAVMVRSRTGGGPALEPLRRDEEGSSGDVTAWVGSESGDLCAIEIAFEAGAGAVCGMEHVWRRFGVELANLPPPTVWPPNMPHIEEALGPYLWSVSPSEPDAAEAD